MHLSLRNSLHIPLIEKYTGPNIACAKALSIGGKWNSNVIDADEKRITTFVLVQIERKALVVEKNISTPVKWNKYCIY